MHRVSFGNKECLLVNLNQNFNKEIKHISIEGVNAKKNYANILEIYLILKT